MTEQIPLTVLRSLESEPTIAPGPDSEAVELLINV
jgi:hypothetical protein